MTRFMVNFLECFLELLFFKKIRIEFTCNIRDCLGFSKLVLNCTEDEKHEKWVQNFVKKFPKKIDRCDFLYEDIVCVMHRRSEPFCKDLKTI